MMLTSLRSLTGMKPAPPKVACSAMAPKNDPTAMSTIASRWSSAQAITPL